MKNILTVLFISAFAATAAMPAYADPASGCEFHTRCLYAQTICSQNAPGLSRDGPSHSYTCHFPLGIESEPKSA